MSGERRRERGGCYECDCHQLLTQPNEEGATIRKISVENFRSGLILSTLTLCWKTAVATCCHGNCREEALGVGYVDDVTADDLAGYFDQMLHLPRPMSDMAQLIYT